MEAKQKKYRLLMVITIGLLLSVSIDQIMRASAWAESGGTSLEVHSPLPNSGTSGRSSLFAYLRLAALNNPNLAAAYSRWQASLNRNAQVTALPEPQFSYAYYIEEVETRVGPQEHKFGLRQTFPFPRKRTMAGEVASSEAQVRYYEYDAAKRALFYRVKTIYYEYYYLGRSIGIMEETMLLLTQLEEVLRARYTVGNAAYANLVKVQVELGQLADRIQALHELQEPLAAGLNAVLNRDLDIDVPFPEELITSPITQSDADLLAVARENNPELAALSSQVNAADRRMDLARQERYPDFSVGLDYISTGDAHQPNVAGSGRDPIMGAFTITLPIWGGKYEAAAAEATALQDAAVAAQSARENDITARIQMVLYHYRDAERRLKLFRDTLLPKAEQSVVASQTAFAAGTVDFVNLLDAERLLLDFALAQERALTDSALYAAELEKLIGRAEEWESVGTRDEETMDEG